MAVYATVVQHGSMRRAARELGLTTSAVSQQIRQLEADTGVTLLRRTTRKLALTDAGRAFFDGCVAMLDAADSAYSHLAELHDAVVGEITLSAPVGFAATHLTAAIQPLLSTYPQLTVRLIVSDDHLDLAREHIDVAITIGTSPPASSLMRKHLATWDNVLVAAPSYLKRHGTPRTAEDLPQHTFIALPPWHHGGDLLIGPGGVQYRLRPRPRVISNNQLTIKQLTVRGCGISFNVLPEVADEIKRRTLVRVLSDWSAPQLSVDALLLPRETQPAKVRATLDALERHLAP
jgi:DNA-binding transcriptional LysR family regulator